jgi:pimeloyl-ACP methyl ester carboxylesterase
MKKLFIAALSLASLLPAADQLRRHGMIGLSVGPDAQNRIEVKATVEGGAGAAAGMQAGDLIQTLDGATVASVDDFVRAVGRHFGGDAVKVGFLRGGDAGVKTVVLKPRPLETSPYADVMYISLPVRGSLRRAIVTRPRKSGRLPAVLFMQGVGCYSMESGDRQSGYGRIVDELEQRGFVTMRVEKTGEGDSEGPACEDLSALPALEADGYVAGLRALKQYDFVDPQKVFVFAHSMGPVVGSLAIAQEPVRGFIAVETVGTSWFEYDLERLRVQAALAGKAPDEVDAEMREYTGCSYRFYMGKETPAQLDHTPACLGFTRPFGGTPYTYMQAVADISLGRQWKQADFPVLVIYGTASPVTTAHQCQYLAELINRLHPGRATYAEVPGMSHDMNRYASQQEYMQRGATPHPFHMGLIEVMMAWIAKQSL